MRAISSISRCRSRRLIVEFGAHQNSQQHISVFSAPIMIDLERIQPIFWVVARRLHSRQGRFHCQFFDPVEQGLQHVGLALKIEVDRAFCQPCSWAITSTVVA